MFRESRGLRPRRRTGRTPGSLEQAVLVALDGLLRALELESLGGDRFRVLGEPGRFDRVFGGQTVAQALLAASATVTDKEPHSLHAYFVEGGTPEEPLDLTVDRVRDGRSISTRQVGVMQGERPLLIVIASFHANPMSPEVADPPPSAPRPDQLPLLQDWVRDLPPELRLHGRTWVEQPPPLELRIGEPPNFLGGPSAEGMRSHWMRLPRDVGDDPLLHTALLAYASDYFLLDMAFRSHPSASRRPRSTAPAWITHSGSTGRSASTVGTCTPSRHLPSPATARWSGARSTTPTGTSWRA